jgi:hypothetical protein
VDARLFWKALAVQTAAVMLLFLVLVALPLPEGFFEDAGFATGPLAWIVCTLVTAHVLSLRPARAFAAAALGGIAGVAAFLTIGHTAGLVAALVTFAACCAATRFVGSFDRGDGIRTRDPRRERPVS